MSNFDLAATIKALDEKGVDVFERRPGSWSWAPRDKMKAAANTGETFVFPGPFPSIRDAANAAIAKGGAL